CWNVKAGIHAAMWTNDILVGVCCVELNKPAAVPAFAVYLPGNHLASVCTAAIFCSTFVASSSVNSELARNAPWHFSKLILVYALLLSPCGRTAEAISEMKYLDENGALLVFESLTEAEQAEMIDELCIIL